MIPDQLKQWMLENQIDFQQFDHPALMTCRDADNYQVNRPGTRLKNLFLRDNYGRKHFLLVTQHNKLVDLKTLSKQLQVSRLGFASSQRLQTYLKVKPGCVSLLALINDSQQQVRLLFDQALWESDQFHCHPLVNTQTLILSRSAVEKFLTLTGHPLQPLSVPVTEQAQ